MNSTPRAWQRMLSGRRLNLLDPSPLDVEIEDIAHGLAFVARWNGQTHGDYPFSVATHSLLVEEIFRWRNPDIGAKWHLAALLHDGAEYVLGDMISPAKAALSTDFEVLETRIQCAIHIRFSLPELIPPQIKSQIKSADLASAYLEAKHLADFSTRELNTYFVAPTEQKIANIKPIPEAPRQAKQKFIERFNSLVSQIG